MADDPLKVLSLQFDRFAKEECLNSSVLYGQLAFGVAKDRELLNLAAHARKGERVPNLFFAAIHFLLLNGVEHPVARFYESLSGTLNSREDPYPAFRSICLEHGDKILHLISSQRVQTNEVKRCACLLPVVVSVSQRCQGRPLFMVEIGAAAGLLLLWDRYGHRYGGALTCGDPNSPVQINCALRSRGLPPVPKSLPAVSDRIGIDLNPIDVCDPDARLWLRALVWPEHGTRARLLEAALEVAQSTPLRLVAGDGVEILPSLLASVPPEAVLCIFRVWTSVPQKARERLSDLMTQFGQERDLFLITTVNQQGSEIDLQLTSFIKGVKTIKVLARCDTHGDWLEWLG